MSMSRIPAAFAAIAALTALTACGNDAEENGETEGDVQVGDEDSFVTDLTFVTGGTAGTYYPLGGELSSIIEENTDATVTYVESGGSADNLGQIYREDAQLALSQNDTAASAFAGTLPDLEDVELDNFGWISNLYPEAMHIIVRSDSGIESIEDLEGRTVAVGDAGSGTRVISDAILSAHGIEEGDYSAEVTDFGSSTDMLADNQIDATMFVVGVPVAGLTSLANSTDVELLSVEADIAEEISGGGDFEVYDISAESYDFLEEDVTTISVFAALVASTTQISEELGYEITAAVLENADSVTLEVGENISLEEALNGVGDIPLHPGAERYFEEQGVDLP